MRDASDPYPLPPRAPGWATLVVGRVPRMIGAVLAAMLAILLVRVTIELAAKPSATLTDEAMAELDASGVENPVTAVLLNFRAYDTWLELGVLMLAMMGALALLRAGNLRQFPIGAGLERTAFLSRLMGVFLPVMLVAAGYLLWRGTHAPGGAFQAGALAAAAGVLARLAGRDRLHMLPGWVLRTLYAVGFALFLAMGLWVFMQGPAFLQWPVDQAGAWIFTLELLATVSIAVTLWSLYVAAYPEQARPSTAVAKQS